MGSICDTCNRVTCEFRSYDVAMCGLPKSESRWNALFGTPERAAETICRQLKHGNICTCDGCPVKPPNRECDREYDALLEWLSGDVRKGGA